MLNKACSRDKCPPNTVTDLVLRPELKTYFPYQANQLLHFSKYIDTVYTGEISFTIDTPKVYIERESVFKDCLTADAYNVTTNYECLKIILINQTEIGNNLDIQFKGGYSELNHPFDYDNSGLNILYGTKRYSFYNFSNVIRKLENSHYKMDSIILNKRNYGEGFCLSPNWNTRIYFNSTYGIIGYVNESTKESLSLKE